MVFDSISDVLDSASIVKEMAGMNVSCSGILMRTKVG